MKKSYCTQNNGDCTICSFANYGLDCANNPIEAKPSRKGTKHDRAMAAYDGFKGGATVEHIKKLIGKELADKLTGHELGLVMSAVNRAYHEGKSSTGAEVVDGDYIWVNCLDKGYDLDALRKLHCEEIREEKKVIFTGNLNNPCGYEYVNDNYPGEKRKPYEVGYLPKEKWQDWYYIERDTVKKWTLGE